MHLMFDFQTVGTIVLSAFFFAWAVLIALLVLARIAKRAVVRACKRVFHAPLPKFRRVA